MGQIFSGGSSRPVTTEELESVATMREALAQMPVPVLQRRDNPHEYLFFALFDGSGQDANNPKLGPPTNIGEIYRQGKKLEDDPDKRIGMHYEKGIGAQSNSIARKFDGVLASTWADGIEKMYREFSKQARNWIENDPQAQISVAGVGYSRGSVQAVGFSRLVDQYGIVHPDDLTFGRDRDGNITVISSRPPLVAPGEVAQAAGLFDPVGTHMPRNYNSRQPPSVISSVSMLAGNEQRTLFPHLAINDPGMTADGRALNVSVPGGHSNVGGGNREPGLEILAGNAMIDYLNRLRDEPIFEKRPVPDLAMMTVYQAHGVTSGFGMRLDRDGQRDLREELANCKIVDPCRDIEPINQALSARFERPLGAVDPLEQMQLQGQIDQARASERSPQRSGVARHEPEPQTIQPSGDPHVDRYIDALLAGDQAAARAASRAFHDSDEGRRMLSEGRALARAERERQPGRDDPLFAQALHHVEALGPQAGGYRDPEQLERVAGAIALRAREAGMPAIAAVVPSQDGTRLFAVGNHPGNAADPRAAVDKTLAAIQPLDHSLQQLATETQRQVHDAALMAERRQLEAQQPGMSR